MSEIVSNLFIIKRFTKAKKEFNPNLGGVFRGSFGGGGWVKITPMSKTC